MTDTTRHGHERDRNEAYLFTTCSDFRLLCAPDLLHPVLPLLSLLSSRLFPCRQPVPHQPVLRFDLFRVVQRFINQPESGRLSPSKLSVEPEHENQVRLCFVRFGQLFPHLLLRHGGATGMQDVHDL